MPGPPSEYKPEEHPAAVQKLAARWFTKAEIAEALGIVRSTLDKWMDAHPELKAAYALGREDGTDRAERALFDRATGYSHPSEKILVAGGEVVREETVEHYPPDPAALKLLLTNRRAAEWRERQEVQHSGDLSITGFADALAAGLKRAESAQSDKPSAP